MDVQRDRDQEIRAVQNQAQARLQEIQQDRDREIMTLKTQAESMFHELQSGRDQEVRALQQQVMALRTDPARPSTPDDVLTQVFPTPFDTVSEPGRAPSVASMSPPDVCFCGVCGNQNVRGRGVCWRCNSTLDANNGTVVAGYLQEQGQPHLVQPQSLGPPVAAAGANPPTSPTRASIAAVGRQLNLGLSGGAGVQVGLVQGGAPNFDPRGPTIQGGVVFRGRSQPGIPEFYPVSTPVATSLMGEGPSKDHDDSSSDTSQGSRKTGSVMPQRDEPPPIWLHPGRREDQIYKIKHLRHITISRLPTDATTCREWRAALMAAISRIDLSTRDVLVKYTSHCMDAGRGRQFRRVLQDDNMFIAFNKHIAAELIKQDVLSTNSDLAHELTSLCRVMYISVSGTKGYGVAEHCILILMKQAYPGQWPWIRCTYCHFNFRERGQKTLRSLSARQTTFFTDWRIAIDHPQVPCFNGYGNRWRRFQCYHGSRIELGRVQQLRVRDPSIGYGPK